jgi:predicted Zn-ribbon and HTH transcriptional regulator
MPDQLLPIRCPKCTHDQVQPYVGSLTVLTVVCPECGFTWALEIASLPPHTKEQIAEVVRH